jgi:hypothetical protein
MTVEKLHLFHRAFREREDSGIVLGTACNIYHFQG